MTPEEKRKKHAEYDRAYRATHHDKVIEQQKRYRDQHKEKIAQSNARYKSSEAGRLAVAKGRPKQLERLRVWRIDHRDQINATAKRYREKNREKIRAQARKLHSANKARAKNSKLKSKYGITLDAYNAMLLAQGNVCAICKTSEWKIRDRHMDHDHKTGKIRGILCVKCNTAIGMMDDNPKIAQAITDYLIAHALVGKIIGRPE